MCWAQGGCLRLRGLSPYRVAFLLMRPLLPQNCRSLRLATPSARFFSCVSGDLLLPSSVPFGRALEPLGLPARAGRGGTQSVERKCLVVLCVPRPPFCPDPGTESPLCTSFLAVPLCPSGVLCLGINPGRGLSGGTGNLRPSEFGFRALTGVFVTLGGGGGSVGCSCGFVLVGRMCFPAGGRRSVGRLVPLHLLLFFFFRHPRRRLVFAPSEGGGFDLGVSATPFGLSLFVLLHGPCYLAHL